MGPNPPPVGVLKEKPSPSCRSNQIPLLQEGLGEVMFSMREVTLPMTESLLLISGNFFPPKNLGGDKLLLDFASQSDRVSSHVPKGNDIDNVTVDVIDDFVETVHHIASIHHSTVC